MASTRAFTSSKSGNRYRDPAMNIKRRAVMSSPPTVTVDRGQGISLVPTVSAGGTGHTVGDLLTLTGGTFAYPAILRVSTVSGGVITAVTVVSPGVYSSNPSNPVSVGSSTGAGTGATFTCTFATTALGSFATTTTAYHASTDVALFSNNFVSPMTNISTSGYFGGAGYLGEESRFSFWTDGDRVDISFLDFNAIFQVWIDGERVQATDFTSVGASGADLLRLVFASARPRLIMLRGVNLAIRNVRVPQGGYSIWKPVEKRRPLCYIIGDSYTYGTTSGAGTEGLTSCYPDVLAAALGFDIVPLGVGSTGWQSSGSNLPATRVANDLLMRPTPDYVIWALGYNDGGVSAPTPATIITNMTAALDAVIAGLPNATQIVIGPWTPNGTVTNLTTVKTTMQGVLASYPRVTFIDFDNVVNSSNKALYTGGDLVHPTELGHEFIGGQLALKIDAAL
jgi:lysophospholipase L1-like esterase